MPDLGAGLPRPAGLNAAIARALGVAPRTVAAHLEHILVKPAVPSRTLAAVRAQRAGLFVPLSLVTGRHGTGHG